MRVAWVLSSARMTTAGTGVTTDRFDMTAKAEKSSRTDKLDIRLSPAAKRLLRLAAEARHKSISEFVLDSALTAAEDTLLDQRTVKLNADQWAEFIQALDAPPRRHARMERLLNEPSVFD